MIIQMIKFGKFLNSRPTAKEAVLRLKQIVNGSAEDIVLDFDNVVVLTPSFADEFINGIKEKYPDKKLEFKNYEKNEAIAITLKGIEAI
ncbi:STAS-like domain-containing protein [Patescibacteria group bacterium]